MNRYDGKCAVVIGGSNGIGLATAKLLADLGVRVLVTGHSPTSIESARATLGETAVVVESDATSPADLQNLAKTIESSLGKIDLLFVNAGMTHFAPLEKVTEDVYGKLFDLNARAPFFTVQKLAPLIADGGSIVFTTSVVNVKGLPMVSVYAATKAALRSMTRSIARELLPRGIRVNAVSPGPINTSILDKTLGPEAAERAKAQMQENNPMKRFGDPIEVAKAVVFLGFDATYTTGAELTVDGGASQL